MIRFPVAVALCAFCALASAAEPRARDLGIPFEGSPGPLNAITDIAGITVGQVTLIEDLAGDRKVRTGVTAILPRGRDSFGTPAYGAWFALNGNGEMTGTAWIDESGQLEGPIMLTNTHSVGVVHDAVIAERVRQAGPDDSGYWWSLPVVAETWDGHLNDINGFHVRPEHAARAIADARGGPVVEGNVGGGTGMICHEFKGGIGTASRRLPAEQGGWTVGVLVQANHGKRQELRVDGYPVGRRLMEIASPFAEQGTPGMGSIVVILATDAPLLPHQCQRLAQRASIGIARTGGGTEDSSGDLFLAFATGNRDLPAADYGRKGLPFSSALQMVNNDHISPLFSAAAEAVEEAIINAILAGEDMLTDQGVLVPGLEGETLLAALHKTGWSVSR